LHVKAGQNAAGMGCRAVLRPSINGLRKRLDSLRTRVKICGITAAADARAAVAAGADALGFVFHKPSARYIDPHRAGDIIRSLPAFVDAVGVVVDLAPAALENVARVSGIGYFQFHGDESPASCLAAGLPFLKALRMKPDTDIRVQAGRYGGARGLLLDAFNSALPGGSGDTFDWARIPRQLTLPVFLAGGLNAANVGDAIRIARPYGVDVSSGVERAPGVKDADKIAGFFNAVADADHCLQNSRKTSS